MNDLSVIDYFCGAGGFSQGFKQAGFNILLGIDKDENSLETFKKNHNCKTLKSDISKINPEKVRNIIDEKDIDVVIGGPPCQGFSIAGDRNEDDERNTLFLDFAKHIESLKPKYFVMENVPGLLSMNTPEGEPVIERIKKEFESIGYKVSFSKLKASNYGTPQHRKRVFIIGSLNNTVSFPEKTHSDNSEKLDYITVKEAISDLPKLKAGETKEKYTSNPKNEYQKKMRKNVEKLENHSAVNHREHIIERFNHIPQGGNMSDAPEELQPSKIYNSRNRRLEEDKPSYTVTSHVLDELLHPWSDRSITVREAARLQGFPDNYVFKGSRNVFHGSDETSQYEQVGNAVPVCLSESIANSIKHKLKQNS